MFSEIMSTMFPSVWKGGMPAKAKMHKHINHYPTAINLVNMKILGMKCMHHANT